MPGKGKRKARRLNPAGQICPIGLSAEPKPRALVVTVSAVLRGRDLKTGIKQPLDNDLGRVFGVQDHCREIIASDEVYQHVFRGELTRRR